MKLASVAAALCFACVSANADSPAVVWTFSDGNTMRQTNPDFNRGYIAGVFDTSQVSRHAVLAPLCPPDQLVLGQMYGIVDRWLVNHPEHVNESGPAIVMAALADAFPCKRRRS